MRAFYRIQEVDANDDVGLCAFEVRKSVVDDGVFPIRTFGPASLALCQRFVTLVEAGARDHEARQWAIESVVV